MKRTTKAGPMRLEGIDIKTLLTKMGIYLVLGCFALSMLLPFFWMVSTSLKGELEVYEYPPKLFPEKAQWSNYREALTILPFGRFFLNKFIIALSIVVGPLLI
ncbi:MAG: carbohydrate ABC transporter permease, partial [bacterium]